VGFRLQRGDAVTTTIIAIIAIVLALIVLPLSVWGLCELWLSPLEPESWKDK